MAIYDYRISSGVSAFNGTGTITVTTASTACTGSGTAFTTQAHVGDLLIDSTSAQVVGSVKTIADNTHIDMLSVGLFAMTGATYQIDPLVNVETLGGNPPFAPKSNHKPWFQAFDTGDGLARGMGRPATTWAFGFVTRAFRDAIRAYCIGKSARVWIRTRQNDTTDSYYTYQAAMLWPDTEQRDAGRRVPFSIEFRDLVLL